MKYIIEAPLTGEKARELRAGDVVSINGTIYTARDAAHKKMVNLIQEGRPLPFDIRDQIIYYVGPCPAKPGEVIGSAGPTTSSRMDAYAPLLIKLGLKGMIGKGLRSEAVVDAMKVMVRYISEQSEAREPDCKVNCCGGIDSFSRTWHRGDKKAYCQRFSGSCDNRQLWKRSL